MVAQKIPIDSLELEHHEPKRAAAVKKALSWCNLLLEGTSWTSEVDGGIFSLHRTINGQRVEVLPLEAARMDLGYETDFTQGHLPVYLNGVDACVRARRRRPRPLHTDMVASLLLLLGNDVFSPLAVPRTLHSILTDEQRAAIPANAPRQRFEPGQPSTSGREFLPEEEVSALIERSPEVIFEVQFEKRDGTLRNMSARWEVVEDPEHDETEPSQDVGVFAYNPTDYHLLPVFDVVNGGYRMVAIDRVTGITADGETHRTASFEGQQFRQ